MSRPPDALTGYSPARAHPLPTATAIGLVAIGGAVLVLLRGREAR
nr:hypothetical protein OG781_08790 [Streptomyces sp. NBC_00830]